jgi:putative SOS response-associated peptidase YedK
MEQHMCGRFFATMSDSELMDAYGIVTKLNLPSRYNIAPTTPVLVVHLDERGQRRVSPMRWGLVPSWAKEVGTAPLFNARAETVAEKPAFKGAFKYRRGLVAANGWYEWQKTGAKTKQAYALHLANFAPLAMACIWEVWEGRGEGSWLETCSILTTSAIGPAAAVHERMPVLIEPGDYKLWMHGAPPAFSSLSQDMADRLRLTPVGPAVGNVANDGPQLLEPAVQ